MLAAYAFFGIDDPQPDFVSSRIPNPRESNVYGYSLMNKFVVFPVWKPRTWNSFCLMFNDTSYQILLNSEDIASQNEKATFWRNIFEITFMSIERKKFFFGALTDLNVWDRTLSEKEVKDFASCKGPEGNHLAWSGREGSVQYENLTEEDVEMAEICQPARESFIVGTSRNYLGLADTQRFCAAALGGKIAVADSRDMFEAESSQLH